MGHSDTSAEHLIHMANDIGRFFAGTTDRDAAILGISNHIKSFWTPKMRRKLIVEMQAPGLDEELEDLPRAAIRLLKEHPDFEPQQLPEGGPEGGGDAG